MADYLICVDDDQTVLNQLSDQLSRRLGPAYRIECAQSGEEALSLIDELHTAGDSVNLVVCDQVMPGIKGDHVLELVNKRWPDVMKILLTGEAGLDSAIYAINKAGLHRYIEKPWEPEDLFLAVQNLLTQFRLRREMGLYHTRLLRKAKQLHSLHEVSLQLAAAEDIQKVLDVVRDAACRILNVPQAAIVGTLGRDQPATWAGLPCHALDEDLQKALEKSLSEQRAAGALRAPDILFPGRIVVFAHADTLYGWLMMTPAPESSAENDDILSILAGAAGATLRGLELAAARLESERLSTIGRMLSSIVHDFRNPMTLIKGYGSMLSDGNLANERRGQYSNLIVEEADRISAMIEELLDYTRGQRPMLRPAPIRVSELVLKLETWIASELTERGQKLEMRLDYDGLIVVDIDRLKRALLNAATNAMDAMTDGGTLTIESRAEDGAIELAVCDTGRGIPLEVQPRVFEPFFSHGKRHGLGLGMTITRKIVQEHGGEVLLASEPGKGTRLTFRFPTAPLPAGP